MGVAAKPLFNRKRSCDSCQENVNKPRCDKVEVTLLIDSEKCLHIYSRDQSETNISNVILELYWQLQATKINDTFSGCFHGCKVRHIGLTNNTANL